MNTIGLNVILESNTSMPLFLTEQEAQVIIERFLGQQFEAGETTGGFTTDGVRWGVRWDKICGLHTFKPQPPTQMAQRQDAGRSPHYRSGN